MYSTLQMSFCGFQDYVLFFIMFMCRSEYGCVHIHAGVHRDRKRVLDLMELELKVVVNCEPSSTGAGSPTQVPLKSSTYS